MRKQPRGFDPFYHRTHLSSAESEQHSEAVSRSEEREILLNPKIEDLDGGDQRARLGGRKRQVGSTGLRSFTDSALGKLWRARSRLYRNQILQENMRLKALAEIYTMHSFAQLCISIFGIRRKP